jgi:hypothetical protein
LLVSLSIGRAQRLVRIRGFESMPAASYRDRFVDLPPIRWFTEL